MKRWIWAVLLVLAAFCLVILGLGYFATQTISKTIDTGVSNLQMTMTAMPFQAAGSGSTPPIITTTPGLEIPIPVYQSTLVEAAGATRASGYDAAIQATRTAYAPLYQGSATAIMASRTANFYATGTAQKK